MNSLDIAAAVIGIIFGLLISIIPGGMEISIIDKVIILSMCSVIGALSIYKIYVLRKTGKFEWHGKTISVITNPIQCKICAFIIILGSSFIFTFSIVSLIVV